MRTIRSATIVISLLFIIFSCGNGKNSVPENIVSEEKLVPLLVDIHLTDAMLSKEKSPHSEKYEKAIKMYPSVLLKHDIDRVIFDSTIRYYVKNPEKFALIYDDVLRELSIREGKVQKVPEDEDIEE